MSDYLHHVYSACLRPLCNCINFYHAEFIHVPQWISILIYIILQPFTFLTLIIKGSFYIYLIVMLHFSELEIMLLTTWITEEEWFWKISRR